MTFSINPSAAKTQAMFQAMAIQQKGNGAQSAIVGGSPAAAPPAAAPASPAENQPSASSPLNELPNTGTDSLNPLPEATGTTSANTGNGIQSGTGTLNADGSCTCFVSCNAGSFPNLAAQGVGAIGGMPGKSL